METDKSLYNHLLTFFLYSRVEKESPGDMCFLEYTVLD